MALTAMKEKAGSDPIDLVLALCHEIGNLLAASRLHTHLIDATSNAKDLADVSATIGELSSRMGSLLAQIRPLVSPVSGSAPNIDPVEVLDGVQRGIEESCDVRVAIDLESAAGLPMASIDPEPLHHMLLTSIYQALEESGPTGKVAVSAFARAGSIVFSIHDESKLKAIADAALKGRALLHAVADAILRPRGGRVEVSSKRSGNRIELIVPTARR